MWAVGCLFLQEIERCGERLERESTIWVTGECRFSKSEKGYVNREIFIDVLKDLTDHLDRKNIARPVMLLIDGFSGHLGLEIAEFCVEFGIQLILLRSNMTHVIQPLGVYIFLTLRLFLNNNLFRR